MTKNELIEKALNLNIAEKEKLEGLSSAELKKQISFVEKNEGSKTKTLEIMLQERDKQIEDLEKQIINLKSENEAIRKEQKNIIANKNPNFVTSKRLRTDQNGKIYVLPMGIE